MSLVTEPVEINYTLTFVSAFHFGTGLRQGLVHRTVARDHAGYLYVPGSTLKGVLRERCEQLARLFNLEANEPHDIEAGDRIREAMAGDPDIVFRIFGSRFIPGQLYFDNARLAEDPPPAQADYLARPYFDGLTDEGKIAPGKYLIRQVENRTQVSLSRRTRTAKTGHLYTSEYGLKQLRFEGQIYGYLPGFALAGLDKGTSSLLLLLAGLLSLDRMGGKKSTGAGRVVVGLKEPGIRIAGQVVEPETILAQLPYLELDQLEREENL